MAGIEPRFERLNGDEPRAFVWARGQRRNVSKGQQAIAMALLYPEPEKGGRGKKRNGSETEQFSKVRLSQARAIVAHSPQLAHAVREGGVKFDDALKQEAAAGDEATRRKELVFRLKAAAARLPLRRTAGRVLPRASATL
jgi:hypothetical protein